MGVPRGLLGTHRWELETVSHLERCMAFTYNFKKTTFPCRKTPMSPSRLARTALAVVFMLLFLGALGLRIWASTMSMDYVGPDHVAAGQGRVYVHVSGELYMLSESGTLLSVFSRDQTGLEDYPIDLRVLRDGRVLLAEQRPARMRLCDPASWTCGTVGGEVAGRLAAQYKVLVDEQAERLLLSDTESGRLWMQPLGSGHLRPLTAQKALNRPNDLALDAAGRLWVADSGNHRLVVFEITAKGARETGHSLDARHAFMREQYDWPMMLARDAKGNWWVAQPDGHGNSGDLLVYDAGKGAVARILLPEDGRPVDVASMDGAMIVTDRERFRLYRVDTATRRAAVFGDASFREAMRRLAEQKAWYRTLVQWSLYAMIAFGALMVLAAIWATPKDKRWSPRPPTAAPLAASDREMPKLGGVYWLKRHPKTERLLRWMAPMSTALSLLIIAMVVGMYYYLDMGAGDDATPERLETLAEFETFMWFFVFFMAGIPVLVVLASRTMKHRLGTDGQRLLIRLADGRVASAAPEKLVYSNRTIAYKGQLFAIQTGNRQPLYADGEIDTYLAPLLRRSKKLGPLAMLRYQLDHGEPSLVFLLLYLTIQIIILAVTGLWRQMIPDIF